MPRNNVFQWPDGRGWLVLAGGADDEIRAQALGRAAADGGIAYVALGGDNLTGERALEDMEDLGAPSGYLVDLASEDDQTITAKLADAGIVVIESGANALEVRSALRGAAIEGIQTAYENGAVILVEGMSAMAFGDWIIRIEGTVDTGLEWIHGVLIAPGVTSAAEWGLSFLETQSAAFVVGIGTGSALALGPDGQIETWGDRQVTVALGKLFKGE
jgi:hypothetical protein